MLEDLSKMLEPHKDLVGTTAAYVTILQFFTGFLICKDIYKKGSTRNISAVPFVGGAAIGVMVLKFAVILQDENMFNVNVAAIVLNSIYIVFYTAYSKDKYKEIGSPAISASILSAVVLSYSVWEEPHHLEFRYGFLVTVLMLVLMGSPLLETKEILRSKDASSIPFPLTFMGFVVSLLWLLYGIILLNDFMIVQNVVGALLCFVQLILCIIYPAKKLKEG